MRILLINPPDWNKVIENPDENGEEFLEEMKSAPAIPLRACDARPTALAACRRALKRAGYDADRWLGGEGQSSG